MAYSTQSDLVNYLTSKVLIELTDDTNSSAVGTAIVTFAITQADSIIDSYLSKKYSVPLSTTPTIINDISIKLASGTLLARRQGFILEVENNHIMYLYKEALKMLQEIANGKLLISGLSQATTNISFASKTVLFGDERYDYDDTEQ